MDTAVYAAKWPAVRDAVAATGDRFAGLLLSVPPEAMATRDWTVADTAAHVVSISGSYAAMLRSAETGLPIPAIEDVIAETRGRHRRRLQRGGAARLRRARPAGAGAPGARRHRRDATRNLMLFGRVSRLRAALSGRVVV